MANATATAPMATLDEFEATPEEVAEILSQRRKAKAQKALDVEAARVTKETGYPKTLYNSKFMGESVLALDGVNRFAFYRGRIRVQNAEEEAFIRSACPGRIYEADMPKEKACSATGCIYVTASSDCYEIHMRDHLA